MKKSDKYAEGQANYRLPPAFVPPQLPVAVNAPPKGDGWLHEIKYDGYRLQARVEDGAVRLLTRRGLDWTDKFRVVGDEIGGLRVRNALIDGEICVLDQNGVASLIALQDALRTRNFETMRYVAFDLLHRDGQDLRSRPLSERKDLLRELISVDAARLRYSDHLDSDEAKGQNILGAACALGAEGIVSKLANASYRSGRNGLWVKAKCITEQEMVVGGFTGGKQLGSLLLGYYENAHLRYAGRVGTGFTERERTILFDGLQTIIRSTPPFAAIPDKYRNAHWVEPRLVVNVAFLGWTANGRLRHATYRYLRDDKPPQEVTREMIGTPHRTKCGAAVPIRKSFP